jgi:hypothetical protein
MRRKSRPEGLPVGTFRGHTSEPSGGGLTFENALSYLESTAEYSNRFEYSSITHDGKINVTLTHRLGAKGNLFLQRFVKAIFHQMGASPKFSSDVNAVTFELE